jgi:hypothetical protein
MTAGTSDSCREGPHDGAGAKWKRHVVSLGGLQRRAPVLQLREVASGGRGGRSQEEDARGGEKGGRGRVSDQGCGRTGFGSSMDGDRREI